MPGTPTFSKAVHFNENMEQVRHFLQVDRPIAVSAGSSPVSEIYDSDTEYPFGSGNAYGVKSSEWEIKLANFPAETLDRHTDPVRVERLFLSADHKTLIGSVAVANIAFQKHVTARFTLDYWKTISEVVAEFNNDVRNRHEDGFDRFNFNIKLSDQANLEAKTLLLCVKYQANGQEYWDNNRGVNYQVDFSKRGRSKNGSPAAASPLGAIPRSRHTATGAGRPRSYPTFDEDFSNSFNGRYEFGVGGRNTDESPYPTIRLKKPSTNRKGPLGDEASLRQNGGASPFATRYDFGASLSAALSTAQSVMERKPLLNRSVSHSQVQGIVKKNLAPTEAPTSSPSSNTRTPEDKSAQLTTEKPALQSAEYNELIQKYCFFGSAPLSPVAQDVADPIKPSATTDGVSDSDSDTSPPGSNVNSGSNTPSPTVGMSPAMDGSTDQRSEKTETAQVTLSRSTSPGPFGSRTASPVSFGYPYHQSTMGGIFPESHTPPVIRG